VGHQARYSGCTCPAVGVWPKAIPWRQVPNLLPACAPMRILAAAAASETGLEKWVSLQTHFSRARPPDRPRCLLSRYLGRSSLVPEMMGVRVAGGLTFLLLTACGIPGSAPNCTAQIDWVDFIQVGSTQYGAGLASSLTLAEADLGPVFSHVKSRVSGNVCDPNYRPKDGDAAYLEPGTPIYQVIGYPPGQLLAAHQNGRIVAFEAKTAAAT